MSQTIVDPIEQHQLRIFGMYCLFTYENPVFLPRVADQVTEWIYDRPPEEIFEKRLEVYMDLYHDHVPALEAANLVTYHQEEDLIELTTHAKRRADRVNRLFQDEPV